MGAKERMPDPLNKVALGSGVVYGCFRLEGGIPGLQLFGAGAGKIRPGGKQCPTFLRLA